MSSPYPIDLVDEARRPAGAGAFASPHRTARADNPLCGDEIELDVDDEAGVISAVAHRTRGCAFTVASASILARPVPGLTTAEAAGRADLLRGGLAGSRMLPPELEALMAVRMFPAHVKCALLPWEALRAALDPAAAKP